MYDKVSVLGTINATLQPVIDNDFNLTKFRWLTLVDTGGGTYRIEGRGHDVSTMMNLIEDRVAREAAEFVQSGGGVVVLIGLP